MPSAPSLPILNYDRDRIMSALKLAPAKPSPLGTVIDLPPVDRLILLAPIYVELVAFLRALSGVPLRLANSPPSVLLDPDFDSLASFDWQPVTLYLDVAGGRVLEEPIQVGPIMPMIVANNRISSPLNFYADELNSQLT